jgi:cell division protease FtsH
MPFGQDGAAPATKQLVDEEVRRIVDDCYAQAVTTLREHRDQLDRLAHTLLQRETLDEDQAYEAAGIRRENAPAAVARGEAPDAEPAPGLPLPAPRLGDIVSRDGDISGSAGGS